MVVVHEQIPQFSVYGKGKSWAVLVGINEYEDKSNYGKLSVCVQDATSIYKTLIKGGFETNRVHLLTDQGPKKPLKREIVAQLQAVAGAVEPDDLLLFYFSGHGDEEKGESYLVPYDGTGIALYDTALPLKRVKEIMEGAQTRAKVIILDACHSGANIGTKGPKLMPEGFIERVFEQAAGLAILASCKQGQLSHEWAGKNCSVYTYYLLEALRGKADYLQKGFITVDDVNKYTVDQVTLWASQHQVRQRPDLNYFVDGDILLVNCQQSPVFSTEEENQVKDILGVPPGRDYLTKLHKVAQSALATFASQDVWGSDCQPIFRTLDQTIFPEFWQVLLSSSFVESPLYDVMVRLAYIDSQKKKALSLINTYMRDQQGGAKHGETQTNEIKSMFTSLIQEIENVQEALDSLEAEQVNLILGDEISPDQQEIFKKYIGVNLEVLRGGKVYEYLTNQLVDIGAQAKKDEQILREDVFTRFKRIPLHALFLCTSEDQEIYDYVLKHWGALNDLSEDICDFHPMLNQFNNAENGYEYIKKLDVVRQSGFQAISDLPAIFFHDNHGASEYISLANATNERDIKKILRAIFDVIKQQPTIASVTNARQLLGLQIQSIRERNFSPSVGGKSVFPMDENRLDEHNKLIEDLRKLPPGDGKSYESLVKRILEICLADDFASFSIKEQVKTYNKKRIRDFIVDNRDSKIGFWRDLKTVRGVEKVLFDAKNYEDKFGYPEITNTLRYLKNKAFGNFVIIVSRRGIKDWDETIEDYEGEGKVILFLDDNDLITMIDQKNKGERASSIIEEKYYNLLDMN